MPDLDVFTPASALAALTDRLSWWSSDPDNDVIAAFVEVLWEVEDVVKDRKVEAGPMRYTYADLAAVLDEIRPKLRRHGLALSQIATTERGVSTVLFHKSGQWIEFSPLLIKPAGSTPQNVGSAITYARRYSILAAFGLATEDDDGRSASIASSPDENPLVGRVNDVMVALAAFTPEQKAEMRKWADSEARSLSGKALEGDADWLQQVEAYIDVLRTEGGE